MDNKEQANEPIANARTELTDEKMNTVNGGVGLDSLFNPDPSQLDFANHAAIKNGTYKNEIKKYYGSNR